jgi:hypothetical protein
LIALILAVSACATRDLTTETTGSTVPTEQAVSTPTTGAVGTTEPPAGDAAVTLEWTEAGLSGETFIDQMIATDGGFIAYRFAHGSKAWVSEDGVEWTEADLDLDLSDDQFFSSEISTGNLRYVAIGGTFDDDNMLLTSPDGFTWSQQELDLEFPELDGWEPAGPDSVVVGPAGYVIQGSMDRQGVDEHRFVVWTSADGATWNLVADPFEPGAYIREILPTGTGYVTSGYVEGADAGGDRFWWSSDGASWEESDIDFLNDAFLPLGGEIARWGDKVVTAVGTEDGVRLWTSADGDTWEPLPASPSLDHTDQFHIVVTEIAAGPLGIVLLAELEPPRQPMPPVVIEKDGLTVTIELETGQVVVADQATGTVLFEASLEDEDTLIIDDQDGSITVVDPDTGESLIAFTFEEFEEAQDKAFEEAGFESPEFGEPQLTSVLFFSPDGQRWTSVALEETFGSANLPDSPGGVVVGDEAVILRWSFFDSFEVVDGFEEEFEDAPVEEFDEEFEDQPAVIWVGRLTDGG